MLTQEHLEILRRVFRPEDHEFRQNKFVFLTEEAITDRLDEVDPSWTFDILDKYPRNNQVIMVARLTVCGVWRDGVGMQDIKDSVGEPEKGAATDALKRCARLFGIGRYILTIPATVTNMQSLTQWLKQNASPSPQKPPSSDLQPDAKTPENGTNTPKLNYSEGVTRNWADAFQHLMKYPTLVEAIPQNNQRANTLNKLHKAGQLDGASFAQVIEIVLNRMDKEKAS